MTYYAYAKNPAGRIEQLRVEKEPGKPLTQTWTGVFYANERDATADMARLNARRT